MDIEIKNYACPLCGYTKLSLAIEDNYIKLKCEGGIVCALSNRVSFQFSSVDDFIKWKLQADSIQ